MAQSGKALVVTSDEGQAVRIPVEFRFATEEVFVRRDPVSGGLILSESQDDSGAAFAAYDAWFRREVEMAVAEADDPAAEWDSQDEVKRQSAVKRAAWLGAAAEVEKPAV